MWRPTAWVIIGCALSLACSAERRAEGDDAPPGDTDTGSGDSDTDADADSDADGDTDTAIVDLSFIWIANSAEGTLSKVATRDEVEVARFYTSEHGVSGDPSRTSVNLYGDMVVTNRNPNWSATPSSVTKFAANRDDCIDRNDNGEIDTSAGPTDVRPWGEDECMIWNTVLPGPVSDWGHGARATAWDGEEDPETGLGGHVWVGTCDWMSNASVFKLDGDTGEVLEEVTVPTGCAYGGAVDGMGGFWIFDTSGTLVRVDTATLGITPVEVSCGYGITIDSQARVWTGGMSMNWETESANCVSRYDWLNDVEETVDVPSSEFLRGIALGVELSGGYVWAADTSGRLYKINEESMVVESQYNVGAYDMIGVAVDYEGYVWTVSQTGNATYKFDPTTATHITVPIGNGPYTYSDMTGVQLKNVIGVE